MVSLHNVEHGLAMSNNIPKWFGEIFTDLKLAPEPDSVTSK